MKNVLVTGAEGFVGTSLFALLKEDGFDVAGTYLPELKVHGKNYHACNMLDFESVLQLVKRLKPELILHLAAVSSVGQSFREPLVTLNANIIGTANFLEAARLTSPDCRFFFISSCEVYGNGGLAINEADPIMLLSPYAASKYAAELVVNQYYLAYGLKTTILRPFNHTGPGQRDDFILASVARQIAEIERDRRPPVISVGNIEVVREFMDARDVIHAYRLAIEHAKPGEVYNVASGAGHSIKDGIELYKKLARKKLTINIDESRFRPHDIMTLVGSGEKFAHLSGFRRQIPFEKTLEDLLNFWRAKA